MWDFLDDHFQEEKKAELTAGFAPPSGEENSFSSTGPHIAGKGSTHAVLTLLTVTRVKHAVLGTEDDIRSSDCHIKTMVLYTYYTAMFVKAKSECKLCA